MAGWIENSGFGRLVMKSAGIFAPREDSSFFVKAAKLILPRNVRYDTNRLPLFADCAAHTLGLPKIRLWDYEGFFEALTERRKVLDMALSDLEDGRWREHEERLRSEITEGSFSRPPYLYYLFIQHHLPGRLGKSLNKLLADFFPELPAGMCFLDSLDEIRAQLG